MTEHEALALFHYVPNKPLSIASMVIFAFFSIFFANRIYMSKSPKFLYILPAVALGESISYMYRTISINNASLSKYVSMTLFSLLVPIALPLVNYMAVGQVIKLSNLPTTHFFLSSSFVSWFFFVSDLLHFWIQRLGELNISPDPQSLGTALFVVDISIQSMTFAAFAFITAYVHQNPSYNYHIKGVPEAKSKLMMCVYITSVLLYFRYIYRVTEYVSGFEGPIATHEWVFYVFDGFMLVACFVTYSVLFIGNYLPQGESGSTKKNGDYIRVSDLEDEDLDNMVAESNKHIAVFNNVQKVNYSISAADL